MSEAYQYWIVRYVPDVVRGERVNVAVIAGKDGADWAIRVAPDLRRASRLGGDASGLRPWLDRIQGAVRNYMEPPLFGFGETDHRSVSSAWVNLISHRFNNILQVSESLPIRAHSSQEAVGFLYPALVQAPEPIKRSRTRSRLVSDMGDFYLRAAALEVGKSLLRRPMTVVGRQRGRFDFAVVDQGVHQLSQAFAFDVRDSDALEQELHSWNFIVTRLRGGNGAIGDFNRGTSVPVPFDVPISVVYQEPVASRGARAVDVFEAAREAWADMGVRAIPSEQLDLVAQEARQLVSA